MKFGTNSVVYNADDDDDSCLADVVFFALDSRLPFGATAAVTETENSIKSRHFDFVIRSSSSSVVLSSRNARVSGAIIITATTAIAADIAAAAPSGFQSLSDCCAA